MIRSAIAHLRSTRKALAFALASALVVAAGCGDDGLGKRYSVSGMVNYKGQPLEEGTIAFMSVGGAPGAESRGAFGVIENGKYKLSTQGDSDGAFPGDYTVTVSARKVDMAAASKNAGAGSARQDDVAKAYKKAASAVPRKYESPDAGLKAKVEAKSNTISFDLVD